MRGEELPGQTISSIYFGGGTPGVLSAAQLSSLVGLLRQTYPVDEDAEITIETNPDDINTQYAGELLKTGFNRISIGVQSFYDPDLELMRRHHNSDKAKEAVREVYEVGFRNISIDLIYGIPGLTAKRWKAHLEQAFSLPISHLSAYHLTFEEGTVFDLWRKQGRIVPVTEEESLEQYHILREAAGRHGFVHYEISNFAREGYFSRHNMIYWNREPYIGLGPSAHSFNGRERRWNIRSLKKYMTAIGSGEIYYESEIPDERERYHDYILTALRTREGVDRRYIETTFGERIVKHFSRVSKEFTGSGRLVEDRDFIRMTPESWFVSEYVMRELFVNI